MGGLFYLKQLLPDLSDYLDNNQYYKAKRADGVEISLIGVPAGGGISIDPSGQRITIGDGINATAVVNPFTCN